VLRFGRKGALTKPGAAQSTLKYALDSEEHAEAASMEYCRLVIVGVGGAGNNAVSRLMDLGVAGAFCVAINTDAKQLEDAKAHQKILIGEKLTKGQGAKNNPKLGRLAIEESRSLVEAVLSKSDIVFVTAGLDGGTGTGAAPTVAEIAKRKGALTVGVVTAPMHFKMGRGKHADKALAEMKRKCDTAVVIDNDKLAKLAPELSKSEAFRSADLIVANTIKGLVETISAPSLINLDFADFKKIVRKGGIATLGVGESNAPNRAEEAVKYAFENPLLDVNHVCATGALVHVAGGPQLTIEEANRVGEIVTGMMDGNARVIWGARVNAEDEGKLKVTLLMTGINSSMNSRLGKIMPQIYDLEPCYEPEKTLNLDLDLYQMENF
jgi:cell division protein FtsZ